MAQLVRGIFFCTRNLLEVAFRYYDTLAVVLAQFISKVFNLDREAVDVLPRIDVTTPDGSNDFATKYNRNDKLDGKGNYTLGVQEQIIYPEIDIDKISRIFGMEITFVTSTKNDTEAYALLKAFGLPFKNAKKNE